MPLFVNEEKKSNETKAIKEFTDRVEPRNVFWKNYSLIENAMTSNEKIPIQVVNFYGIGGTGKTRLLEQLRYEMGEKARNAKVCYIDFEKLKGFNGEPAAILNAIKMEMKNKFDYEFPLFELAYYEYKVKLGYDISKPELKNILLKNKELSFLASFIEEIPLVGTFAKIASMVDEGASLLRNRFNDATLKNRLKDIDSISAQEQENLLSYYFALDFQNNLKKEKCPFVFQIDTYERLVNELTEVGNVNRIDDWLKGKDGLIRNVNNVLWVIAGREKLKWELQDENWKGSLDQHLLGDLSQNDSSSFLRTAGISDEKLIEQLYNLTGGTPIFLDMCVDTYYKLIETNKPIVIDEFGGDRLKLVERFFTYMNDPERDFVTALAFVENWTDENVENQIKPILGNFSFSLYEKIKQFSFVIQEGANYKIHETIRDVITEEASELIKNKFNKAKKDIKEEKIKQIEQITVKNINKEESISEDNEKTEKEESKEYVSEIYINSVKREEYRKVIDEMVVEIIDFLYKKPKFTKTNKKLYCDMINDLIAKIEEFFDKYDARYDYKNIDKILSYKIFKNTYEYKRLEALNVSLYRYYLVYNEAYHIFNKKTDKIILEIFNKNKNIYKDNYKKVKPITYTIKFLANGNQTIAMKDVTRKKDFFSSKELDMYEDIFTQNYISKSEIIYVLIKYTRRDYKNFLISFNKLIKRFENSDYIYVQRMMARLALEVLFEEFKGKPGTGYMMREYTLRKNAEKYIKEEYPNIINNNEIEKMVKERIFEERHDFINKYMNITIKLINKNKTLIDETYLDICIKLLNSVINNVTFDDEAKLKLAEMLIENKDEILYSNNINLIEKYSNLIYLILKIPNLIKEKYYRENVSRYKNVMTNSLLLLDLLKEKLEVIHGKTSDKARKIETSYKVETLLSYGLISDLNCICKKYKDTNSYILKLIQKEISENIKRINSNINVKELEELYELLYDVYTERIDSYYDYKNIQSYDKEIVMKSWHTFLHIPIEICKKGGDIKHFEKAVNYLYYKVEKFEMLPTVEMYKDFSTFFDVIWELKENPKNNEIVKCSLKILDLIYNKKHIQRFNIKNVYNYVNLRHDMVRYASLVFQQIIYKKYLTEKNIKDVIDFLNDPNNVYYECDCSERNLGVYLKLIGKYEKQFEYLNSAYFVIKNDMPNWYYKQYLVNAVFEESFNGPIPYKYINKELYVLERVFYRVVLGIKLDGEYKRNFDKIISNHTRGIFKDKRCGEDYLKLKEVFETIMSYNIGAFMTMSEAYQKINNLK